MLKVDLERLDRDGRLLVEEAVPPDAALWEGMDLRLRRPLSVRLDVRSIGPDVLARGTLDGELTLACRRCLVDVHVPVEETVEFLFRAGITEEEAAREEAHVLPARTRELELGGAVREQMLVSAPRYALCREACRGLCPQCGARLNEETCDCEVTEVDERWAPLRRLKSEVQDGGGSERG